MNQILPRCSSRCAVYLAALAILLFASSLTALGQIAGPGYDLFQTGSGASVNLTGVFTGLGQVNLQGVPIQSASGNTDTIMYRPQGVPSSCATNPPCQITVNLYALFMESTSPVTYNGQSADVYVTVNASSGNIPTSVLPQPDTNLQASGGTLTLTPNSAGTGGTFNSSITVNADVIIMPHGVSPTNSSAMLAHGAAPTISLSTTNSSFSTTAPPGSPNAMVPSDAGASAANSLPGASSSYPSGGIYFNPVHQGGPHPVAPAKYCANNGSATDSTRLFCISPFNPVIPQN